MLYNACVTPGAPVHFHYARLCCQHPLYFVNVHAPLFEATILAYLHPYTGVVAPIEALAAAV